MSGRGHGDARHGGHGDIGPVEPAGRTEAPPPDPPHPRGPVPRRQILLLAGLAAALAALLAPRGEHRPGPAPPPDGRPPVPALVAHLRYAGPAPAAPGPPGAFALRLWAAADSPYEVVAVRQGYPGLSVSLRGGGPVPVTPGQAVLLTVDYRVTDCSSAPPDAGMPFLDVTLRNTRAMQTVSQILGGAVSAGSVRTAAFGLPDFR